MEILVLLLVVLFLGMITLMVVGLTLKLLGLLLVGLVVGALARLIMPSGDFSLGKTILLGLGGSLLATLLGKLLHIYQPGQGAGFVGALLGALLILSLYRILKKALIFKDYTDFEQLYRLNKALWQNTDLDIGNYDKISLAQQFVSRSRFQGFCFNRGTHRTIFTLHILRMRGLFPFTEIDPLFQGFKIGLIGFIACH